MRGSIGSAAVVEAFDKGGKVVDTARRYKVPERTGPEKPIPSFELTVRAPAIASVRFSGAPPAELPPLAGVVERMGETKDHHALILRVDAPCPGIVAVVAPVMGGQVVLSFDFHLYGERAADTAARDEPAWQRWMGERFPFGGFGGSVG